LGRTSPVTVDLPCAAADAAAEAPAREPALVRRPDQGSRGQGDRRRRTEAAGKTDGAKGEAKDATRDVKRTAEGVRDSLKGDDAAR
jgi:hypothetical protein